ncbi:MAG: NYN domain-containing protein [Thermodesulfovibrionales bacterium]|nr:NYN domain-containing protein [Thermodesulfovibrionales bacterium]
MLNIIIDGYNVIGTGHKDLNKERETFVNLISNFSNSRGHSTLIIFDGHSKMSIGANIQYAGATKVIYTPVGVKADDYIINHIKSHQKKWIVVSNDNYIREEAWRCGCVALDSDLFLEIVCFLDTKIQLPYHLSPKRLKELQKVINSL